MRHSITASIHWNTVAIKNDAVGEHLINKKCLWHLHSLKNMNRMIIAYVKVYIHLCLSMETILKEYQPKY